MDRNQQEIIEKAREFMREKFASESTGHDWWHTNRVFNTAIKLAEEENANMFEVQLGALLHDIADHKFHGSDLNEGPRQAEIWMSQMNVSDHDQRAVITIIREVSFKGAGVETPVTSLESACVQDADRLDALGAIGIARTFAYGGAKGNPMYVPDSEPELHDSFDKYATAKGSTVNHFYEKLFLLKERMNTKTAKSMAEVRHKYMEAYLNQFFAEWEGKR